MSSGAENTYRCDLIDSRRRVAELTTEVARLRTELAGVRRDALRWRYAASDSATLGFMSWSSRRSEWIKCPAADAAEWADEALGLLEGRDDNG